jgi:hypothetical protein
VPNRAWRSVVISAALLLGAAVLAGLPARPAVADQPGCRVDYAVTVDFTTGFFVYVTIANDGPATNGWQVDFTFPTASQRLTSAFNARWAQNGQAVSAVSQTWNARIPTGSSITIGFVGAVSGPNPVPTDVRITGCGDRPFPPTPLVTSPSDNFVMYEGQVTLLRAETLGFPGTVTRMDFFVNGVLFGTATAAPFFVQWYPLPLGTFTITATGHDDRGTVATSAPVRLVVRPMP